MKKIGWRRMAGTVVGIAVIGLVATACSDGTDWTAPESVGGTVTPAAKPNPTPNPTVNNPNYSTGNTDALVERIDELTAQLAAAEEGKTLQAEEFANLQAQLADLQAQLAEREQGEGGDEAGGSPPAGVATPPWNINYGNIGPTAEIDWSAACHDQELRAQLDAAGVVGCDNI